MASPLLLQLAQARLQLRDLGRASATSSRSSSSRSRCDTIRSRCVTASLRADSSCCVRRNAFSASCSAARRARSPPDGARPTTERAAGRRSRRPHRERLLPLRQLPLTLREHRGAALELRRLRGRDLPPRSRARGGSGEPSRRASRSADCSSRSRSSTARTRSDSSCFSASSSSHCSRSAARSSSTVPSSFLRLRSTH